MKKYLSCIIFIALGLISSLYLSTQAQISVSTENKQTNKSNNNSLSNYIKVSSLPMNQRPKFFSDLPAEEKANLFKLNLALQFVKRQNLTKEQKNVILEGISITSPEIYKKDNVENRNQAEQAAITIQNKVLSVFPEREAYEIFASINNGKDDVTFLEKYLKVISLPTMAERQKIFREASPEDRSDIWKGQMVYFLGTYELNKNQQDFIVEIISLSTPKAFTFPSSEYEVRNVALQKLDALEKIAFKLFSKEEVFKMFMRLGEAEEISSQTKKSKPNSEGEPPPSCFCNWYCGFCQYCDTAQNICTHTTSGCGWTLSSPCTGLCKWFNDCPLLDSNKKTSIGNNQ
jgi:hypothetical protein